MICYKVGGPMFGVIGHCQYTLAQTQKLILKFCRLLLRLFYIYYFELCWDGYESERYGQPERGRPYLVTTWYGTTHMVLVIHGTCNCS